MISFLMCYFWAIIFLIKTLLLPSRHNFTIYYFEKIKLILIAFIIALSNFFYSRCIVVSSRKLFNFTIISGLFYMYYFSVRFQTNFFGRWRNLKNLIFNLRSSIKFKKLAILNLCRVYKWKVWLCWLIFGS